MGKTKKDMIRAKYKRNPKHDWLKTWKSLTENEKLTIVNYSKCPSWWNRMVNNRPARKKDKTLCLEVKKISKAQELENEFLDFTHVKKPMKYYW